MQSNNNNNNKNNNNNPRVKRAICCSYCKKSGHKINHCDDPNIDILYKKAINATIFSVCITVNEYERTKFMMRWIDLEYTQEELRILGYKINCFNKIEDNKECFLKEMATNYLEIQFPNSIPGSLDDISDETIKDLARVFVETVKGYDYIMSKILRYLRPPQRKFKIETMLICTETLEELIETNSHCPICLSNDIKCIDTITTNCQHTYCSPCLQGYFKNLNKKHIEEQPKCALCRAGMYSLEFKDPELFEEISNKYIECDTSYLMNSEEFKKDVAHIMRQPYLEQEQLYISLVDRVRGEMMMNMNMNMNMNIDENV